MQGKHLGRWSALALVAGTMLGIGIFIAPPVVARYIQSPVWFLALWLGGGLAALCGALCMAELGAMLPRAGGEYLYLRRSYGPGVAFATGWLQLLAIFPGSLAAMAVGTATFQLPALFGPAFAAPVDLGLFILEGPTVWAVLLVLLLTGLNHLGIALSGRVQLLVTIVPLAVLLVVSVVVIGDVGIGRVATDSLTGAWSQAPGADSIAQAYLPIYFAYSGWNAAIYVGGEIAEPGKNLPRAVVGGTLVVLILYVTLCAGFLSVFDTATLAGVGEVGTAAAGQLFGHIGVIVVTLMILLAMLGSINGSVMTGSRIGYAMAEQGHFPPQGARLHARFGTPVVSLWTQAGLAVGLIALQGFEQLMSYASCAMLISGSLTVYSVVRLRKRMPDRPRPYKVAFYPWVPYAYIGSSLFVLAVLVAHWDISVFMAAGWFGLALLLHRLVAGKRLR